MTRILLAAIEKGMEIDLVAFDGGSKHNAIPREAFASCRIPKTSLEALQQVADACKLEFDGEFEAIDPGLAIDVEALDDTDELREVFNQHARDRLLHLLRTLPHGVISMSREVEGLVETSNNVAIVATSKDKVEVTTSHRSSVMPALFAVREQIRSASQLAGGEVDEDEAYPGWKPNPDSVVVNKTLDVYEELFGKQAAPQGDPRRAGVWAADRQATGPRRGLHRPGDPERPLPRRDGADLVGPALLRARQGPPEVAGLASQGDTILIFLRLTWRS